MAEIRLESSWKARLGQEFGKPYMQNLRGFLAQETESGQRVYPPGSEIFSTFDLTPFEDVRVVILGQDPYHGPGQAHGLSFSVRRGVRPPPSLANIYKELRSDLGIEVPSHGCLDHWANQGVLLLNAVLTVREAQAASHRGKGWEEFTDSAIATLARERENLVFILWGSLAQQKGKDIDPERHLVIRSPHPSPLSAHRGFFGSKPFSQANAYLADNGHAPIDWNIPS